MANETRGRAPIPPAPPAAPTPPAVTETGVDALLAAAEAEAVSRAATERAAHDRSVEDSKVAEILDPKGNDLHPLLSNKEVLEIRAEARAKMLEKQKAAARKDLLAQETRRLAEEEGLTTGSTGVPELDEMVTITLDLAEHSSNIPINGRPYWHNCTYTVPRHVAQTLAEVQFRGWEHQAILDGKGKRERLQRAHDTVLTPTKVERAPARI